MEGSLFTSQLASHLNPESNLQGLDHTVIKNNQQTVEIAATQLKVKQGMCKAKSYYFDKFY
jgi:hypothetical protein